MERNHSKSNRQPTPTPAAGHGQPLRDTVAAAARLRQCATVDEASWTLLLEAAQACGARGGSLYLLRERHLRLAHALDPGHAALALHLPLAAGSVFETVIQGRRPFRADAAGLPPRLRASGWRGYHGNSFVALPLLDHDARLLGVLSLHDRQSPPHRFTPHEQALIEMLAQIGGEVLQRMQSTPGAASSPAPQLETLVRERTAELELAYSELEAFSYSVSHDLRAPLRAIDGFTAILAQEYGERLGEPGQEHLHRVRNATRQMSTLVEGLLQLANASRQPLESRAVDLAGLAREVLAQLRAAEPERQVEFVCAPGLTVRGDERLLRVLLENLLGNAWKYSARRRHANIRMYREQAGTRHTVLCIEDNGVGFDMRQADKLFQPFQRLHAEHEFPGSGIGLATVARIAQRHGGSVWAEAELGRGTRVYFSLPTA